MLRLGNHERCRLFAGVLALTASLAAAVASEPERAAAGYREKVLHRFCPGGGRICHDGVVPAAGLIMDTLGNLYGTTESGGIAEHGLVFELTPNATGTAWSETVLHSFCSQRGCPDGRFPVAGLIMDTAGNLYGTTVFGGGSPDAGVVFELTPNASGTAWEEKVLYSFCVQMNCPDGVNPTAGLIMDAEGNLYGMTQGGGPPGQGTVFKLTPNARRTAWTETVLYSFCAQPKCADGSSPYYGALIMDAAGSLFGMTGYGGLRGGGVVFELMPEKTGDGWTEAVLNNFCGRTRAACHDRGELPLAGLIVDGAGSLYGTTFGGGINDGGVVFELTPNKARASGWTETVLHRFCQEKGCLHGAAPAAGPIMDAEGNLYGTTVGGGINDAGLVFELVKSP